VRQRHLHRVFYGDREGEHPDRVAYFPAMDYGVDANRTLELQDLIVFTDYLDVPQTLLTREGLLHQGAALQRQAGLRRWLR
jgi:hypothetical protein